MKAYFLIGAFLFCWIQVPKHKSDDLRMSVFACISPLLAENRAVSKVSQLETENRLLRSQIEKLSQYILDEKRIDALFSRLEKYDARKKKETARPFFERRLHHLLSLAEAELTALPAQVIYRDPSSWSSSLWINAGEDDNISLGKIVVAKNSPVVIGSCLVGIVDYVGKKQSKIRLITDAALSPAVRATRGISQNADALHTIALLLKKIEHLAKPVLQQELKLLQEELTCNDEEKFLAKGELHGSSAPLWRALHPTLTGIGFNFDYPDLDGVKQKEVPILQKGDLIVTTGFDGVFPPDLQVGTISTILPPKTGEFAYTIEVDPSIHNLHDLKLVFILPPRNNE